MPNKANFRVFGLKTRVGLRIAGNWGSPRRVGQVLAVTCGMDSLRVPPGHGFSG
jgi:hypothetical protein